LRRYSPPLTLGGGSVLHNRPPKLRASAPGNRERYERLADPSPAVRLRVLIDEAGVEGLDDPTLRSLSGLDAKESARTLAESVRRAEVVLLPTVPRRYLTGVAQQDLVRRVV